MRSLNRTVLSVALLTVPLMGTGCLALNAQNKIPVPANQTVSKDSTYSPRLDAARRHEDAGNLEVAKRLYTAIYQENPKNEEACHRLGLVYAKLGRYSEADVFFQNAVVTTPNNARLLADRGYSAFLRKDYEQAEEWLEKSTELDPHSITSLNDSSTIRNLAVVRAWLKKDDSSLATFRKSDSEAEALRNLSAIQIARGDKNLGLRNYELAQAVEPKASLVPQLAETIDELTLPPFPAVLSHRSIGIPQLAADSKSAIKVTQIPVEKLIIPEPTSHFQTFESGHRGSSIGQADIILAPLAHGSDSNALLVSTCVRPSILMATYPLSVTTTGFESDSTSLEFTESRTDWGSFDSINSGVESENLTFELPVKRSMPEENYNDTLETPAKVKPVEPTQSQTPEETSVPWYEDQPLKLEELAPGHDFDEICLVYLRDSKKIVRGLPEFSNDYHGQMYKFSTAEALQKFKSDPDRYSPAAAGLDLVLFHDRREVNQGSLKYAIWYRRRLYLFSSQENRELFQQNPQIYLPAE